jgi:hypothetical protein
MQYFEDVCLRIFLYDFSLSDEGERTGRKSVLIDRRTYTNVQKKRTNDKNERKIEERRRKKD